MDPVIHLFEIISPTGFSAKVFQQRLSDLGEVDQLRLQIHSEGGDILHGFSIYNQILAHPARVVAEVQVLAASMASVIAMAADEIRIASNGYFVLHNPWDRVAGESTDLRLAADLLDAFKAGAIRAYQRHASLSAEDLSRLMDGETWLSAEEAVEAGFAHQIVEPAQGIGRLDLSGFRHVPDAARSLFSTVRRPSMSTPSPPEASPVESPENLWEKLGNAIFRRPPAERSSAADSTSDSAAVLALERRALRIDRAELCVDRDLGPHRESIEPADLETIAPLMLRLKTAELDGDASAGTEYKAIQAILPKLASSKAGSELAANDDGALETEAAALSTRRLEVDRRHAIDDDERARLVAKYPGCRPGDVRTAS